MRAAYINIIHKLDIQEMTSDFPIWKLYTKQGKKSPLLEEIYKAFLYKGKL